MVTYDDVLFQGIEIGALAVGSIVMVFLVQFLIKHHRKGRVWLDLQLPHLRKQILARTDKNLVITKKYGVYQMPDLPPTTWKAKMDDPRPFYRAILGYPFCIGYQVDRIPVDLVKDVKTLVDGKETVEKKHVTEYQDIVKVLPAAPSSYRISAYLRDNTHAQVYGRATTMELLLMVVAVLVVIGILISVVK